MAESDDTSVYDYQTAVACGGCGTHKNVKSFCLNCDADLCDSCKGQLIHRKHTVLPRTHPKTVAARMSTKVPCKQHPGEYFGTYCNTCQKPCCHKCIPKNHDKHEFSNLDVAAKCIRDQLSKYTTKQKGILRNREKLRNTIKKRLTQTKADGDKHKKAIRQKCQTLRKSIDDMETSLLTQIDKMLKEDTKQLEKQLTDIKANEERIRKQLASCNDVMKNASDVHVLTSFHDFKDMTSFDIPKIVFPGEVDFRESSSAFPKVAEIIGRVSRRSDTTMNADSRMVGFVHDVDVKPSVPLDTTNLSVEEMAQMMTIGTRVKRGRDWPDKYGNEVMILSHSIFLSTCIQLM